MERILVDMDNVLADFDGKLYADLVARHPELEQRERRNFLFRRDYPEYSDEIEDIVYSKGFYDSLPIVDSAIDGLVRIIKNGMEPVICSTPLDNEFCIDDKLSWIRRELVPTLGKKILYLAEFTWDKSLSEGLVLIDDNPDLRGHTGASWEQVVFLQDYSRGSIGTNYNIDGWRDKNLENILNNIKEGRWVDL